MTGTNQPLNLTLTASSPFGCTNSFQWQTTVLRSVIFGG
jgi:hypothetical protein